MASLTCPRCRVPLRRRGEGDVAAMHVCETCDGVFIDGPELMTVCRTLAHLPERRDEVRFMGARGSGIAVCPRCEDVPYELEILGERIDFCVQCAGTWLDGAEVRPMAVDLDAKATRRAGGYRHVVEDAPTGVTHIPCAQCRSLAPLDQAFVTLGGYVCGVCILRVGVGGGLVASNPRDPEEADRAMARRASEGLTDDERERVKALRAPTFFDAFARWLKRDARSAG